MFGGTRSVPEWLTFNNVGAFFSIIAFVVALATLWAATKAREAAQEARGALRAQALAEAVEEMSRGVLILKMTADQGACDGFALLGGQLQAAMRKTVGRHRDSLGLGNVYELEVAAWQLETCLKEIPDLRASSDDEHVTRRLVEKAVAIQGSVALVAGGLRGVSDTLSQRG